MRESSMLTAATRDTTPFIGAAWANSPRGEDAKLRVSLHGEIAGLPALPLSG